MIDPGQGQGGANVKIALNSNAGEFASWLFPQGRREGRNWKVGSLNGESGSSLSITIAGDKVGVWQDFAKGDKGGNLVELFRQARQVTFTEALKACAEWAGVSPSGPIIGPTSKAVFKPDELLSVFDCKRAIGMALALANDEALQQRIATKRGWKAETIEHINRAALCLGVHEGKLAFIYETGIKLRDRHRKMWWLCGVGCIWRQSLIPFAQTIYICEGETDAITLLDAGLEEEPGVAVVAQPSCDTFKPAWAELFRDKDVTLVLDADPPGQRGTASTERKLAPVARSLSHFNWEAFSDGH